MSNAGDLIDKLIRRKIPRAEISVTVSGRGYSIGVRSDFFQGAGPAERQSMVYSALDRAPLELLAQISAIECTDG